MLKRLSTTRLVRHLLFWAGVTSFFFIGFYTQPEVYKGDPTPFNPVVYLTELFFASLLTFLFYTYILIYSLLPLLFRGSYGWFTVGLLSLNITTSLVYEVLCYEKPLLMYWIGYDSSHLVNTIEFTNPFIQPIFFESNLVAGLMVGIKLFSQWQQKQAESQRLEREKLTQELELLKLQLNPAFLFGSLHTLYHLTQHQAKQAPEVVLSLAHFLRYVLYENKAETVPLALEMDIIRHYVSLQQAMYPADLEVSLTVRGDLADQVIPPYVLFPLVENAFQRLGLDQPTRLADEPAWVSIDLAVTDTQLTLKVINGQPDTRTAAANSMDMAAIRKQLYFHYADAHELQILAEADAFIVTLTIPVLATRMFAAIPQSTAAYGPPMPDRR